MATPSGSNKNSAIMAMVAATLLGIAVLMFANGHLALGRPKKLDDDDEEPRERDAQTQAKNSAAPASAPAAPPAPPAPPTEEQLIQAEYERLSAEGVAAFKAQKYDEAVEQFTKALELGQTHSFLFSKQRFVYQNRSASFDKMGLINQALDDCAKILQLDFDNSKAKARRERLYKVLIERDDLEQALVEQMVTYTLLIDKFKTQRLLGMSPELPPAPEELEPLTIKLGAKALEQMEAAGELQLSKSLPGSHTLKQILRMLPSYTSLMARMADLRPIESITADLDALPAESEGEKAPLYFERALVYVADGRIKRADEDLDKACQAVMDGAYEGPQSPDILSWAGLFIHLRNESDRALTILKKARELKLNDSEICVKLSAVHLDKEEVEEGKRMLANAAELAPDCPYVHCWMAQSHMYGATDPQEAIQATIASFRRALEIDENFVPALYRLGQALVQMGQLEEAEQLITKARKLAPRDSDVAMVYAALLGTRNDMDGATKQLDKAVRLEPSNPQPYYQKAVMAAESGHIVEAMDQLRQLLSIEPSFLPAHMLLIQLNLQTDSPIEEAQKVLDLIDKALAVCRTKEDVRQLLYFKVTLNCRIDALKRLGRSVAQAV